ncbi:DUF4394 domain-containing protein [Spirosoma flavum]|uniref:DUF4394 domain-containing protein n=1 Tax=Spirosoma flavum TaxID=2048557 RepID=A0ABW6ANG0_9BACT
MLYKRRLRNVGSLLAIGSLLTFNACQDHRLSPNPATLPDATIYALNDANQLLRLNIRNSNAPLATIGITGAGLQNGERMLSIDFRPATGQLYGVSNMSRLFVINPATGEARPLTTAQFTPGVAGMIIGLDFNPTVDRIRLVSNNGQDLRLNPETGTVAAVDGSINGVSGAMISAVAYTNNRAGATTTTLYDIDPATDRLYIQNPPNNGTLTDVGPLGLDITGAAGFDIAPDGNGLVAVTFNGSSELQQINLSTGRLQKLGDLPGTIIGLAIPTEPVAYAIDGSNNLLIFNPMNPSPITKTITGLQSGEMIYGIDFRPVNGQLYAIGSTSRLYTINASSGAAALVGTGPLSTLLSGNDVGFDFNPTVDRIRVTTNTGQNLRLNPNDGAVAAIDGALNPGMPNVTASAYTNNFAGATTTTLYNIDTQTNMAMLFQQTPPNAGTLVPVGSLGFTAESANGFDIGGTSGTAYALLRSNGSTRIYTINLMNGASTSGALLPGNPIIRGFALGLGF